MFLRNAKKRVLPYTKDVRINCDLDVKECRLVKGWLTALCTWRLHLYVTRLPDDAMCRKCGQEEEPSCHIIVNGKFWLGGGTAS
jgi:hypothetical protein